MEQSYWLYVGLWICQNWQLFREERNCFTEQKPGQQREKILFWHNSSSKMFMLLSVLSPSAVLCFCLLLPGVYKVESAAST